MLSAPLFRAPSSQAQRGFTLIEALIGIAVAAVLATLAVPSFQGMLQRYRTIALAHEFSSTLLLARSEAVRRGARVTVCPSANATAAAPACGPNAPWAQGWIVFLDNVQQAGNTAGVVDAADTVLKVGQVPPGITFTAGANFSDWIAYTPSGRSRGNTGLTNGTFQVCQGGRQRDVTVAVTGRVTVNNPTGVPIC